ncbi:uncharacterized protein LOC119325479 [Triticum dicoccoides]|uniref:uncharacterized protein LOC119325479 n=1 Tax=Triticum dicoccoides TaxID=85692 RepID=UPI000E7B9650|nr:uncharacterized protein LOC119325479 [Triticum dicoccoides]
MAARSPPRPVLLLLLLALLCCHIALCSSAAPAAKPKPKLSSGRKELVSTDDDEPVKAPKATAAAGVKKKVASSGAKNQTKVLKGKKPEESTATTKVTTKKATGKGESTTSKKPTAKAAGDAAKPKVPKLDKAAAKPKSADSAKSTKAGAAKPAKSEGGAPKAKKPSNSTADSAKSSKKPQVVADGKADSTKSSKKAKAVVADGKVKANSTVRSEEAAGVEEDVVFAEEAEGTEDLMSEFRGLPARLHQTLMPDLARLSYTSKAYLSAANAGIAGGVRPVLGGRWGAAAATAASVALLLLPLCMLTALVRRMGPYLPLLHRALLLSQAYLAIYFGTLALAAAATGLEPLRFFHAASPAAYAWTQAAQSLGFMGYLVLQMVDLVAVFSGAASPEEEEGGGDATKALGLAQMVVGLAVGLHYYAAVFHRAAAGEAPRANWRVYAVYAACFVIICACARAEKRKKAYLAGAEEWKKS